MNKIFYVTYSACTFKLNVRLRKFSETLWLISDILNFQFWTPFITQVSRRKADTPEQLCFELRVDFTEDRRKTSFERIRFFELFTHNSSGSIWGTTPSYFRVIFTNRNFSYTLLSLRENAYNSRDYFSGNFLNCVEYPYRIPALQPPIMGSYTVLSQREDRYNSFKYETIMSSPVVPHIILLSTPINWNFYEYFSRYFLKITIIYSDHKNCRFIIGLSVLDSFVKS
jgi:hypothetical protein